MKFSTIVSLALLFALGTARDCVAEVEHEPDETSPVLLEAPKPGTVTQYTSPAELRALITANEKAGVMTKVFFTLEGCGPCEARKPGFVARGRANRDASFQYVILYTRRAGAAATNAEFGVNAFPTEQDFAPAVY